MNTLRICILSTAAALLLPTAVLAQSNLLSDTDLARLAESHSTAADHLRLAAHYDAHAAEHEKDAKLHEDLAKTYDKEGDTALAAEARHYASHSAEAAEALRNMAKIHKQLAAEHNAKGKGK